MKFSKITILVGLLVGIVAVIVLPVETTSGGALIFLVTFVLIELVGEVGIRIARAFRRDART
jgi:hypothetical protein